MTQEALLALRRQPAFAAGELTERIIAEKQGSIGWLTFNNPSRRNAISIDMWEAIPKIFDRFEQDPQIRVIVLKGEGDKAFVSGADVSQYEKQRSTAEGIQYYEEIAGRVQERFQNCDKVLIATNAYGGSLNPLLQRSYFPLKIFQVATEPLPREVRARLLPGGQGVGGVQGSRRGAPLPG